MYLITSYDPTKGIVTRLLNEKDKNKGLEFYYENIGCDIIDIVRISRKTLIICDDEGLLKRGNPIFSILLPNGEEFQIAGTFMIAKKDGAKTVGFNSLSDVSKHLSNIKIGIIGITD